MTSFMAGKKRGAAASSNMWSSSKAKKNKKNGGSGAGAGAGSSSSTAGFSEANAAKLFAELADPDDPDSINMEGAYGRIVSRDSGFP